MIVITATEIKLYKETKKPTPVVNNILCRSGQHGCRLSVLQKMTKHIKPNPSNLLCINKHQVIRSDFPSYL